MNTPPQPHESALSAQIAATRLKLELMQLSMTTDRNIRKVQQCLTSMRKSWYAQPRPD